MKKIIGFFFILTIAYSGYLGIHRYNPQAQGETEVKRLEVLETKLKKTLVLMGDLKKITPQKLSTSKAEQGVKVDSFQVLKTQTLNKMNQTYKALKKSKHLFRHEIKEMIEIVGKMEQASQLNRQQIYAKNWTAYTKKISSQIFQMSESNKKLVKNMLKDMEGLIKKITTQVVKKPLNTEKKLVSQESPVTPYMKLTKKSIGESLEALKNLRLNHGHLSYNKRELSYIWLAVVSVFALIALWMSSGQTTVVRGTEENEEVFEEVREDDKAVTVERDVVLASDNNELVEDMAMENVSERDLFEEITNHLGSLCQAKGLRLEAMELDDTQGVITRYDLFQIEAEIESFLKTIISSLENIDCGVIRISVKEAASGLKFFASVVSDEEVDINMSRIAEGFGELETKLEARNGLFNIEQNIGGNEIDFIMQVALDDAVTYEGNRNENGEQRENTEDTGQDQAFLS